MKPSHATSLSCSFVLLAAACGHGKEPGAAASATTTFKHDAPAFQIELPAGVAPTPKIDPGDGTRHAETTLTFDMPRGETMWISYSIPFGTSAETIHQQKEMFSTPSDGVRIVGSGELTGGGAWVEHAAALYHTVTSWAPTAEGAVVSCWITSTEEKAAACKTLRAL